MSGFSWREIVPRSPLLLHDSVQTQTSRLPAHLRDIQAMLHHTKAPHSGCCDFPRQEREQNIPKVSQEQEYSCQMAMENKCQMTLESNALIYLFTFFFFFLSFFFFFFTSKLGRQLHKRKTKRLPYSMPESKFHSELRSLKQPSAVSMVWMARYPPLNAALGYSPGASVGARRGEAVLPANACLQSFEVWIPAHTTFSRGCFSSALVLIFHVISASGPNCRYIALPLLNAAAPLPAAVLSNSSGMTCHLFPS